MHSERIGISDLCHFSSRLISYTNSQEEYYYNSHRSSEDKTIWEDEWTESTESFVTSDSTTSQPENADSTATEANVAEGK